MKNLILVLIFILGIGYYYIPHETKIDFFQKVGIDATFLKNDTKKPVILGDIINLSYDKYRNSTYNGDITNGKIIDNSLWASKPYVKCFYEKDFTNFNGNTMLHKIYLTKNKTAVVKLTTLNPESNLSLYVYKTTANNEDYPPEIQYVHDCLNDFGTGSIKTIEMKGNTAPTDIVIGVSGSNGSLEGGYKIDIQEK